jgi:hypothetical protein
MVGESVALALDTRDLTARGAEKPQTYTRIQIALHWIVVGLLIAQYSTSGAIVRTRSMHMIGQRQNPSDLVLHMLHNDRRCRREIVGASILCLPSSNGLISAGRACGIVLGNASCVRLA